MIYTIQTIKQIILTIHVQNIEIISEISFICKPKKVLIDNKKIKRSCVISCNSDKINKIIMIKIKNKVSVLVLKII